MTSNKTTDLQNRLIMLEKFLELKSNECAYYRSKVHLMQMNSFKSKRSSSEDTTQNSTRNKHRQSSVPLKQNNSSIPFDGFRKSKHKNNQNQNSYEEVLSYSNQKQSSSINDLVKDKNLINQILISYLNKHLQQIITHDNDFSRRKSSHTVLMLRLSRRFIKSLVKPTKSKLKVQISSELLNKLFQSIHLNTSTSNNHKNSTQAIHAKADIKTRYNDRLPIIRHIAQTKSDDSNRKYRHHRIKKRHIYKSSSTSHEEESSLTNVTQSIETSH